MDHCSIFNFIYNQITLGAGETLVECPFESTDSFGLLIASYSTYNLALLDHSNIWFKMTGLVWSKMLYHPYFLLFCGINPFLPVMNAKI